MMHIVIPSQFGLVLGGTTGPTGDTSGDGLFASAVHSPVASLK
jgi:hypothetical protein